MYCYSYCSVDVTSFSTMLVCTVVICLLIRWYVKVSHISRDLVCTMIAHTSLVYVVHKYKLYIIYYNLTSGIGEKMTRLHLNNTKHKMLINGSIIIIYGVWDVCACVLSFHHGPKVKMTKYNECVVIWSDTFSIAMKLGPLHTTIMIFPTRTHKKLP